MYTAFMMGFTLAFIVHFALMFWPAYRKVWTAEAKWRANSKYGKEIWPTDVKSAYPPELTDRTAEDVWQHTTHPDE